jgi:hypothetical protein
MEQVRQAARDGREFTGVEVDDLGHELMAYACDENGDALAVASMPNTRKYSMDVIHSFLLMTVAQVVMYERLRQREEELNGRHPPFPSA